MKKPSDTKKTFRLIDDICFVLEIQEQIKLFATINHENIKQ
jgi:hypothetical protein